MILLVLWPRPVPRTPLARSSKIPYDKYKAYIFDGRIKHQARFTTFYPQLQVIFISHQWLGTKFPDPLGHQVALLREALRRLMDKSLKVEADLTRMDFGEAISYEQAP